MDENIQGTPQGGQQPQMRPPQPGEDPELKPAWQAEAIRKVWEQQGAGPNQPSADGHQQQYNMPPQLPPMPQQSPMYPPPQLPNAPTQQPVVELPDQYSVPPKKRRGWLWLVIFLLLLSLVGIGAIVYLLSARPPTAEALLSSATNSALKTQTYKETLTIKRGEATNTYTRWADLRKLGEPLIYVDNIASAKDDGKTEVTVVGGDYYVKKHYTKEALAKTEPATTKKLLTAANGKWIKAVEDGEPVKDSVVGALGVDLQLQNMRTILPAPVIVGYFSDENQQKLQDFMRQNQVYASSSTVEGATLAGEQVWQVQLSVAPSKVLELNSEAARLLGGITPAQIQSGLKGQNSEQMVLWVQKSDARIVQYEFTAGDATYTYNYQDVGSDIRIEVPKITPRAAISASDADIQKAAQTIADELIAYQKLGNALPVNEETFKEYAGQRIDEDIRGQYNLEYNGNKPEKGYIFYQYGATCNSQDGTFQKTELAERFAVVTALTNTLYCKTNSK